MIRKMDFPELERFFNLSQDLFCIVDFDGNFKYVNHSFVAKRHRAEIEVETSSAGTSFCVKFPALLD